MHPTWREGGRGHRVFSRDILKGGNIGVQLERSSFHQNFEENKGYSPGFFFQGLKKYVEKVIHLKVNEKRN